MSYRSRPIVKKVEGEKVLITYIKRQIHEKNGCCHAIVTGLPGQGKSWSCLSLACTLDPNFTIEKNLFFRGADFMRALADKSWPPGTVFILDEAGIDLNNLNWQDALNRGLNAFFQTSRHRNFIIFLTVPSINFVSKGVRTLMNMTISARGFRDGKTKIVPLVAQYNPDVDKMYEKRIVMVSADGSQTYLNATMVPKAPKNILEEYEIKKKQFTQDLFSNVAETLEAHEEKKRSAKKVGELTDHQKKMVELLKSMSAAKVAEVQGINVRTVYETMTLIKSKGVVFKPIKDDNRAIVRYDVHE